MQKMFLDLKVSIFVQIERRERVQQAHNKLFFPIYITFEGKAARGNRRERPSEHAVFLCRMLDVLKAVN